MFALSSRPPFLRPLGHSFEHVLSKATQLSPPSSCIPMASASGTLFSSNTRVFSPNSSSFASSISDHPLSQTPTIPEGLCKPFHSWVPKSVSSSRDSHCKRGFLVKAKAIQCQCPKQTIPSNCETEFQKKILYLESIGIDAFSLIENHPMLISVSLADIKSIVELMTSMDFSAIEFRRIVGMCPEVLTTQVSDIIPVFTFLIREARVNGSEMKRVINRRPRLLVCSVSKELRPTLYFLQSIGIYEWRQSTIDDLKLKIP
ncbi:hypothetical protein L6164_022844 [Bauhinia variegata]|uniref:Uncharacterized protein n=1 Tax=Bauhinia variegata TaxID=167791 RepID=A0ACB9MHB8_BAUVA|nr:hypothetical protein L6164_022844 [Bauhinia variegata]